MLETGTSVVEGIDKLQLRTKNHRVCALRSLESGGEHNGTPGNGEPIAVEEEYLQTRLISAEEVRKDLCAWKPSMVEEYTSLVHTTGTCSPLSHEDFAAITGDSSKKVEVLPGKVIFSVKARSGRKKTRIVGCGNFQQGCPRTKLDTHASGISAESIRLLVRFAGHSQWTISTTDIKTAFLNAPIVTPNEETIIVRVPSILRAAGVCQEAYWQIKRALYGLDVAPRSWTLFRNKTLGSIEQLGDGTRVTCKQLPADSNIWEVIDEDRQVRIALIGVYVDDLMLVAPESHQEVMMNTLRGLWTTSEPEVVEEGKDVSFAGYELRKCGDAVCHQISVDPAAACDAGLVVMQYLKKTMSYSLQYGPAPQNYGVWNELQFKREATLVEIFTDASFCPDESCKSFQSAMMFWGGCLVMWAGSRQSLIAASTAEAELISMVEGYSMGRAFLPTIEALCRGYSSGSGSSDDAEVCTKVLYGDNAAAIQLTQLDAGAWRTRHLRLRGATLRQAVEDLGWKVVHLSGLYMPADIGTKVLGLEGRRAPERFGELTVASFCIGLGPIHSPRSDGEFPKSNPQAMREPLLGSGTEEPGTGRLRSGDVGEEGGVTTYEDAFPAVGQEAEAYRPTYEDLIAAYPQELEGERRLREQLYESERFGQEYVDRCTYLRSLLRERSVEIDRYVEELQAARAENYRLRARETGGDPRSASTDEQATAQLHHPDVRGAYMQSEEVRSVELEGRAPTVQPPPELIARYVDDEAWIVQVPNQPANQLSSSEDSELE
ncbi:pKIWI502, partial [Symbiodinium necroappetens]